MQKQILINTEPKETRVAVLEGNTLQEYYVERPGYKRVVGNIYKGRVDAIVTGLAAAFVELGMEKDGFLYAGNVATDDSRLLSADFEGDIFDESKRRSFEPLAIDKLLKKGQEILIQIEKEAIGTKGPRITQYISIPGRFLVLMPLQKGHIGISKKIEGEERGRMKKILSDIKIPGDVGLIVRTAAQGAAARELGRELKFLLKIWGRIRGIANREKAPKLVYEEYDLILRTVRDLFTNDVECLVIDSKDEYRRVMKFLKMVLPSLRQKVRLYRRPKGLFEEHGIEKEIDKLYAKKVQLKSRGTIVIEQTESLVAIDVNTAGYAGKKNPEETAFATNLEAAREIARQIRLRDMGGIIIIDFIDMELKDHRRKVQHALEEALKRDKAKTEVLSVSSIGVIEMTRQRMGRSLLSMSFRECPYCRGDGHVKSVSTIAIDIFRNIGKVLGDKRPRSVDIRVHPEVAESLKAQDKDLLHFIERRYHCRVNISPDPTLHVEDAHILPL